MEEIVNMVTGCLVPKHDEKGEDSEDEGGDDIQWLGYKEVAQLGHGKSLVPYERPKRIKGDLIDLETGRSTKVAGSFHMTNPWWQVTILRTRKTKDKCLEPKDYYALCYRLRDDCKRYKDRVVHLFLSKLEETLVEDGENGRKVKISPWFAPARIQFETYLRERSLYDDLDLLNLEERLEAYVSKDKENKQNGPTPAARFKLSILLSAEFHCVRMSETYPELLHYLPQLFPGNFTKIISLSTDKLGKLKNMLEENPGHLGFKAIISKSCGILGCESTYEALTKSGLLSNVPRDVNDAILMYEYIKKETKENGHTYVQYDRILDVQRPVIRLFEEALQFLNKHKVTKTLVENGSRLVFLMPLWQAENKIAKAINSLIKQEEMQPWQLEVNWDSEDFSCIRTDNDQLRAASLIADKPVVVISGNGGCGKTYVVTRVITAARATRQQHQHDVMGGDTGEETQSDMGDISDEWLFCPGNMPKEEEGYPEKIELLLTAPTGKAANLLGKRAKCPSFTLHQVIYSYRNLKEGMPWKHKDVNTLVVDECSLVSVTTFSFLVELLQEHARLRRIVLLGDIRQLPSIEPGNFLTDTFNSLARIGCAIELRNNHRAESTRIVDNATMISRKQYPVFEAEQFSLRKLPASNPSKNGDDYVSQDISVEVLSLLNHDALKDHVTSQFISFTRRVCESINDLCCKRYSDHRIQENGKYVFRTGDKICCTKNGYVNLYEDQHGVMTCYSHTSKTKVEDESEGGVERTVNHDEDTSLPVLDNDGNQSMLDGTLNTTAGSSKAAEPNQIRLCNGEIFFIITEVEKNDDQGIMRSFLQLSDKDTEKEFLFFVDKAQMRRACKIRHAWARTIHTFQGSETDNIVYVVGSSSWRQNWQHVYTAVTRGRKSVFIIGQEIILRNAIRRTEIKRQTSLRRQLLDMLQKNKDFNTTQSLQRAAMNMTTNHSMSSQSTSEASKYNSATDGTDSVSCDHHMQPMRNELTIHAGNTTLDNTQLVTDILTSLACEHDISANSDIEEYDSDDSQSLFTDIKPVKNLPKTGGNSATVRHQRKMEESRGTEMHPICRSTSNVINRDQIHNSKQNKTKSDNKCTNCAELNVMDCDDVMNSNINSYQGESDRATQGSRDDCDRYTEQVKSGRQEEMIDDSDPESDDSESLISPPTTRARVRANVAQLIAQKDGVRSENLQSRANLNEGVNKMETSDMGKLDDSAVSHLKNKFNHSKLRLPRNRNAKTPANVLKARKYRYSIHGVGSPVTPLMNRTNFSPDVGSAQNASSPVMNMPLDFPSGLDDIQEPKSNESIQSQWSEIDESDYLKLVDETPYHALEIKNPGAVYGINDSQRLVTPKVSPAIPKHTRSILSHEQTPSSNDMSTNSQWSDVDDEQYLTLEIEDINNMTRDNYTSNTGNGGSSLTDDYNAVEGDSVMNTNDKNTVYKRRISENSMYREHQKKSPEICIPDSPPSPSILETPHRKPMQSPSRKRGLYVGPDDVSNVSPIKHSLAKLQFK